MNPADDLVLGISAYYHDSAAALVKGGCIEFAAQEERFTRKKFDAGFPKLAIQAALRKAGCDLMDLKRIVFYDKPLLKFDRLLETYLAFAPRGFGLFRQSMPIWVKEKIFLKQTLLNALGDLLPAGQNKLARKELKEKLRFSQHHLSHAASAFYPSPFDEAAVLVIDGVGEWSTASIFLGSCDQLNLIREIHFPHSLGLLYSAFTYHCGFKVNSGEYKLMGLAPYGQPKYADTIRNHLIDVHKDGSFRLNMEFLSYCVDLKMANTRFDKLFGWSRRNAEDPIGQNHMDLAASIQLVTEEVLLKMTAEIARKFPTRNLCLAGGVALNCVANGKVLADGKFQNIWIPPAPGDAGGALGAALIGHHICGEQPRRSAMTDGMMGAFLGTEYSHDEIEQALAENGAIYRGLPPHDVAPRAAQLLADGKTLGWFQGRMEFGPRALGARSILADPRSEFMQSKLNLQIKFRESFRPFAPAILREDLEEWFEIHVDSPYMLLVARINKTKILGFHENPDLRGTDLLKIKRSQIPAVTHVDCSARVQTVHERTNPLFHGLLREFKTLTGCPILVNTSFNVRGEPIVERPVDAIRCFMGTDLDALVIGRFLVLKEEQNPKLKNDYASCLEKD